MAIVNGGQQRRYISQKLKYKTKMIGKFYLVQENDIAAIMTNKDKNFKFFVDNIIIEYLRTGIINFII